MDILSLRALDRRRLREAFLAACDPSLAEEGLRRASFLDQLEVLGEGARFRCFALPVRKGPIGLVLKLAGTEIPRAGTAGFHTYVRALRQAAGSRAWLAPPMTVLEAFGRLALVQPRANGPLEGALSHWHPLPEVVGETLSQLREEGLRLHDIPQGGTWNGIPFLYDWSDLEID